MNVALENLFHGHWRIPLSVIARLRGLPQFDEDAAHVQGLDENDGCTMAIEAECAHNAIPLGHHFVGGEPHHPSSQTEDDAIRPEDLLWDIWR